MSGDLEKMEAYSIDLRRGTRRKMARETDTNTEVDWKLGNIFNKEWFKNMFSGPKQEF